MKRCCRCKTDLPQAQFHRNKATPDGLSRICKACACSRAAIHRRDNPRTYKAIEEARRNRPDRIRQRIEISRRHKARHPNKVSARLLTNSAIRNGTIKRGPCEVCGKLETEAHHDNYNEPLEVRWFCTEHHKEKHYEDNKQIRTA